MANNDKISMLNHPKIEHYIDRITAGDALSLLQDIPDNSVDVVFADPPFNLGKKYNSTKDNVSQEMYLKWSEAWLRQIVRVIKPTGSVFVHNIPKWLTYYASFLNEIAIFKHWIAWDALTMPMGKSLQPAHYGILYYVKNDRQNKFYEIRYPHRRGRNGQLCKDYGGKKKKLHPFGPLVSDVWADIRRIRHNKYRDSHPCQLPIHLLERIVLMTTDENDIVLDPFVGTGTTAIAAKRLGRHYIGFEIDEKYAEIAREKLRREEPNSKLGNIWVSYYLGKVVTIRDRDWEELAGFFSIPSPPAKIDTIPIKIRAGEQ